MDNEQKPKNSNMTTGNDGEKFGEMKISGENGTIMQPGTSINFRSPMPQFGGGNNGGEAKPDGTFKMPTPMPEFGGGVAGEGEASGDLSVFGGENGGDNEVNSENHSESDEVQTEVRENETKIDENQTGPVMIGEKKGKNSKRVAIITVILLLALLRGGVFAWQIFGQNSKKVAKPAENSEKKDEKKTEDIKIPETDEEILSAVKESLAKEDITAEGLKIEKKEKNLVMVAYAGGVAILEMDGITNPIVTKGKNLTDFEGLYGAGKVPVEFLHGKMEDRIYDALARKFEGKNEEVRKKYKIDLTKITMDGEKSEFLTVPIQESEGGGFAAFFKQNMKDGRYYWVAGGQAATIEDMKALKENGFPEKYWKNTLESLEKAEKDKKENEAKSKEEEEKKKKEELEKAKNSEEAFKNKIYKGLAKKYGGSVEEIKKKHSISLLSNDNDGKFINVRYGNCDEEQDKTCGYISVKMIYTDSADEYTYIASNNPLKSDELKKMRDLSFPEKYWKADLEKLSNN